MATNGSHYVDEAKRLLDESMTANSVIGGGFVERCIARAQVNATLAVALEIRNLNNSLTKKESTES